MEPLSADDPRTIGEFRLHAQLGAGGMGQVYLGFSPAGRAVAVKVIHQQFARDQEFLRRFSHEVAAASSVGGMYTAPVVEYDLQASTPWLATAYVPGPTLASFIHKHGPLPEAALWRFAAGLAEALRAVHAKGLIHRDLKPANVLLADSGPHVIDFGISRASSSLTQLTSAGMAVGTPEYMSPEQAQAQPVNPPSDIFSLGCVLAYAATGRPPFTADSTPAILYRIVSAEPDLSAIPPDFRRVVAACLQKNPADRPTPGQVLAMINEFGPATPVTLGSFWPDAVARGIATEQAEQTPEWLTPPAPFAGATPAAGAGRMSGTTQTPAVHTPTALATPPPGQVPGVTGNSAMIPDGYLSAAQRPSAPTSAASDFFASRMPPPQAYTGQQPGGQAPPGQAPFSFAQGPYAPSGSGAPYSGQAPSPYGGQPPSYPGQQPSPGQQPYPQQPSGPNPMGQYAPGRRKPMASEVPPRVRNAIRLMYSGFAVTVIAFILSIVAYSQYNNNENTDNAYGDTAAAAHQSAMVGYMAVGVVADFFGLACWIWLAMAARRGRGWTRTAGLVLLLIYTCVTLIVVFGTRNDPSADFTTLLVWAFGLAAVIPLRSAQARQFFAAWRKR